MLQNYIIIFNFSVFYCEKYIKCDGLGTISYSGHRT